MIDLPGRVALVTGASRRVGRARTLALEIALRGLTTDVVAPGLIETDTAHALAKGGYSGWAQEEMYGTTGPSRGRGRCSVLPGVGRGVGYY